MGVIFMNYLNTTFQHNSFVLTDALGYTHA